MPLFDFDYEWSWDEYIEAVPTGIPFVGKWVDRSRGQWNPLARYWNLSEEELMAVITVNVAGGMVLGTPLWLAVNFYEDYRAVRFILSGRWFTAASTFAVAYATHHVVETSLENVAHHRSWWVGIIPMPVAGLLGLMPSYYD